MKSPEIQDWPAGPMLQTHSNDIGTLMERTLSAERPLKQALRRGFFGTCPNCGDGKLFTKYLKVENNCQQCGEALHHHEADDAPAYFTILIVGHILVPLALIAEKTWSPSVAMSIGIWVPAIIIACLVLLPRIKGALVSFQWSKRMHGFNLQAG